MRIYALNTESGSKGMQGDWMREDIGNNEVFWRIAQYHKPVRPHRSSKSEGNDQYDERVPIFDEFRFALASEADAHTVKTTWPIVASTDADADEGFVRHDSGTVYIGERCWEAPLRDCDDPKSWTRQCPGNSPFDCFQLVWMDGSRMEIRTVKFANVDEVGVIREDWSLTEPENLDVWDQGGHREIIIDRTPSTGASNTKAVKPSKRGQVTAPSGQYDLKGATISSPKNENTGKNDAHSVIIHEGRKEIPNLNK